MVKFGIGIIAGVVWFIALLAGESYRHHEALTTGATPWIVLIMVAAGSSAVVWAARAHHGIAVGVTVALAISMGLGLIEGPAEPPPPEALYGIPGIFAVGLGSVVAWVALGVAAVLAATKGHRSAMQSGNEPVVAVEH
ncbi:hypothetical protein [uncultured Cellulomonas sp.]|uniref:hypothetical protein n=1 Tax=uncultured Cellulomonas sp. TaxID=189682 RepID=UPI0026373FA3|nr:hypothetical protein [uncultured Cellulomonas sp.]